MPSSQANGSAGLRSRKIDYKRPLFVYRFDEIDDLEVDALGTKAIPLVSTGVEKEEEEEHHLQAALVANTTKTEVVIPTPDASQLVKQQDYETLYLPNFNQPKTLIRFSSMVEDVIGTDFNADEQMEQWISEQTEDLTPDEFENVMNLLEACGDFRSECPSEEEAREFLAESNYVPVSESVFSLVYSYWKKQRYDLNGGKKIKPILKMEEMSLNPDNDPYVCFRRREVKTLRKARRGDNLAVDKLKKLKEDITRTKEILDLICEREHCRAEILHMDHLIFEKRLHLRRLKKILNVTTPDPEVVLEKKKKYKRTFSEDPSESTKIRIPIAKLRDAVDIELGLQESQTESASIDEKVKRIKYLDEKNGWLDTTEKPLLSQDDPHWSSRLGIEDQTHTHTRRRVGRGGRVIFDRCSRREDRYSISETPLVIGPDSKVFLFRSFQLSTNDLGFHKYTHQQQVAPQPVAKGLTFPVPPIVPQPVKLPLQPPQQIRTPNSTKKRTIKNSGEQNTQPKKKEVPQDPRQERMRNMLQLSQQRAQQAQMQIQVQGSPTAPQQSPSVQQARPVQFQQTLLNQALPVQQQINAQMAQQLNQQMSQQMMNMPMQMQGRFQLLQQQLMGNTSPVPNAQFQNMFLNPQIQQLSSQIFHPALQNRLRLNQPMMQQQFQLQMMPSMARMDKEELEIPISDKDAL
ncbi:enhancer of polycomb-like-domain-containing protein [Gorgonomyces haynaldii]|nr:enhancer of polycomb-like-domain-containing protein [Gorgonomyces haynaldii]